MTRHGTRFLALLVLISAAIYLTASGVHEVSYLALAGGYATAAGYMLLVGGGLLALERTLHPGEDWLSIVEEDPIAVAIVLAGTLISFALITAYAVP
jgi:hypothetical protein